MPGATITTVRPTRPVRRLAAPTRLRTWAAGLTLGAAVLLAVTSFAVSRLGGQLRAVADHAAPQAATASDLYFALSDLDAQVARLVLLGNSDSMSSNRLEALRGYQARGAQIDADLAQAVRGAVTDADQARCRRLADDVALYREWAWQAIAVQSELPDQGPGRPPGTTLGYYAQAGNVLHGRLLPTATALRQSSEDALARAYAAQRTTAWTATGLTVGAGGALLAALVLFQVRLARRYRRLLNPALILASLCVAGLVVSASVVFLDETTRLHRAHQDAFGPYLALTRAQAVSYDAAGDTSRYLIATNPAFVRADVRRKSRCLVDGGACDADGDMLAGGLADLAAGPGTSDAQARAVRERWQAYQKDHDRIVALADAGELDSAVATLTGLARGDAAFDFYYYDTAVSRIAGLRRAAFDDAMAGARSQLAPWPVIPAALMVAAMLLILLAVRPRLAEYR